MAPSTIALNDIVTSAKDDWKDKDDWTFSDYWRAVGDWFARFFRGVNHETIDHPYYIAIALFVIVAWPHILMLPVWFTSDAVRRVDDHTRNLAARIVGTPRRRRRDNFIARYRSLVSATYEPPPSPRPPLFGGTPLTDGDFRIEEERQLPIVMKIIRWSALAWAVFILGREWYHVLERID